MQKLIRTWVYSLVEFKNNFVVIKKSRWPFTWLYDLPWWKIEHWENNIDSLKRELNEELWLKESDYKIQKLISVEEDFVKYVWNWEEKDEHIIAIVYLSEITNENFNLNYKEIWWDSSWIILIDKNSDTWKTSILEKMLNKI